jgi:hypothetical protein
LKKKCFSYFIIKYLDVVAVFPDKKIDYDVCCVLFSSIITTKYVIEDSTIKIDTLTNTSMINTANAVEAPLEVCYYFLR